MNTHDTKPVEGVKIFTDKLEHEMYARGRGLLEEAGDDFNMATSDFIDFLMSDVTDAALTKDGYTYEDAQRIARKVAKELL